MLADGYKGPVLVSEGDSWFQYPIKLEDTIDHLYAKGFAVRSLDAAGDTLENMLKDREYVDAIGEAKASIFLFSAGGNDAQHVPEFGAHHQLRQFAEGRDELRPVWRLGLAQVVRALWER